MNFIILFIILSLVNVIFSTVRSLTTINSGKWVASLVSAGYFSFYNIMLIYTVADFPLWEKCVITFACNLIGVFVVKLWEEKSRKDNLWKIEVTVPTVEGLEVAQELKDGQISFNSIPIDKWYVFNCYCKTQNESLIVKNILSHHEAKYFVSETKIL